MSLILPPFDLTMDWSDLSVVKEYAKWMKAEYHSADLIVIKDPEEENYNITHKSRTDLYRPEWVVADFTTYN